MSMRHILFAENRTGKFSVALFIKELSFNKFELEKYYAEPLASMGLPIEELVAFNMDYSDNNKTSVKMIKECLESRMKAIDRLGIKTILCADPNYFKVLTGLRKADPHHGYVKSCVIKGFEHVSVILSVNYAALFYNPVLQEKLNASLDITINHLYHVVIEPGANIVHSAYYPETTQQKIEALTSLHQYPDLTVDIETYSLKFNEAKIATIAFAWDEHNGIAFTVNYADVHIDEIDFLYKKLQEFFETYKGSTTYHGATFDIKILIYELYMRNPLDNVGLIQGLEVMYRDTDCTKIITYLATNTTAENKLDLKSNAAEFAGNWAQDDIKDITKIDRDDLLKYNLIDALSTWYLKKKNTVTMIADNQTQVYEEIMRPSMKVVTQMELTGMPLNNIKVEEAQVKLAKIEWDYLNDLHKFPIIKEFEKVLRLEAVIKKNAVLKRKVVYEKDFIDLVYNPGSPKQTAKLLHDHLGLPILDRTPTKQPSVGSDTLKKLLNQLISEHGITEGELQ